MLCICCMLDCQTVIPHCNTPDLQVCGLKWSPDDREIASGGNDNQLYIWNLNSTSPVIKFSDHNAAVKAIAWSPHQHGLLASGGGTADRCIRFWNSATNTALNCIDTGLRCKIKYCMTLCVLLYAMRDIVLCSWLLCECCAALCCAMLCCATVITFVCKAQWACLHLQSNMQCTGCV